MSSFWRNFANISSNLKTLAIRMRPTTLIDVSPASDLHDIPPLTFPALPSRLSQLLELGISPDHFSLLLAHFEDAVKQVDKTLSEHYYATAPQLREGTTPHMTRSTYIQAFQNHLLTLRSQTVARLWNALLSHAQSIADTARPTEATPTANVISSTSSPTSSGKRKRQGRPAPFTSQQTFALSALFAHDQQYSLEDKDYIAKELNLTRDQVNRWFCNARARKNVGARPISRGASPDSVRTVSSDHTNTETNRSELTGSTPELTLPTSGVHYPSYGLTNPTYKPNSTSDIINPPLDVNISAPAPTHLTSNVDSLDDYMNYVAYLELEQIPADLAKNTLVAHQQITNPNSTSENVHINIPTRSSSSIESDAVPRSAPWDLSIHPVPETWNHDSIASFNDPLFDSFNLNPIPPLSLSTSTALAPLPSNDLFPGLDLAEWGVPS